MSRPASRAVWDAIAAGKARREREAVEQAERDDDIGELLAEREDDIEQDDENESWDVDDAAPYRDGMR